MSKDSTLEAVEKLHDSTVEQAVGGGVMKREEATRAQVRAMQDELLNPAIEHSRIIEIIRVFAGLRPGLIERVVLDHEEYRQNRKQLLRVLRMETTAAA